MSGPPERGGGGGGLERLYSIHHIVSSVGKGPEMDGGDDLAS